MLILTRSPSEVLIITTPAGERLRLATESVQGRTVRLESTANVKLNINRLETLRVGEMLHLQTPSGKRIDVKILSVKGIQARLGMAADKDVVIDREEIHQRKLAEKNAA